MDARVKEGFLYYPVPAPVSSSYFSSLFIFRNFAAKSNTTSKTWSKKRFVLFSKGPQGVQRLEERGSADERDPRRVIIPLNDCVKIWTPSSSLIEIVTKDGAEHSLKVNGGDEETADWLLSLQKVAFNIMLEKEEENQLYSGFNEDETLFVVKVIASPVKALLDAPDYMLQLTPESIVLLPLSSSSSLGDANSVFTWSLRDIRRYGSSAETFTLEAGRRCASGPGLFSFATAKGTFLFSQLSEHLRELMHKDQAMKGGHLEVREKPTKPPRKTTPHHYSHHHRQRSSEEDSSGMNLSLTPPPSPLNCNCTTSHSNHQHSPSPSSSGSNQERDGEDDEDELSPEYENLFTLSVSSSPRPSIVSPGATMTTTAANAVTCIATSCASNSTRAFAAPPAHYLQNEVEYAVVLKDKRK